MAQQIGQHVSGFDNWLITKHEQGYLQAFEGHHDDLVYLTAGDCNLPFSQSSVSKAWSCIRQLVWTFVTARAGTDFQMVF